LMCDLRWKVVSVVDADYVAVYLADVGDDYFHDFNHVRVAVRGFFLVFQRLTSCFMEARHRTIQLSLISLQVVLTTRS